MELNGDLPPGAFIPPRGGRSAMSDADAMPRRIHRLVTWPISHPWTIVGIAAGLAMLAAFFASRLRPNGSLAAMFPAR